MYVVYPFLLYYYGIGLMTIKLSIPMKSVVFLVIKGSSNTIAVAAINESPKDIFLLRLISIAFSITELSTWAICKTLKILSK